MIRTTCKRVLFAASLLTCLTVSAQDMDSLSPEQLEKLSQLPMMDRFVNLYKKQCGVCHGE